MPADFRLGIQSYCFRKFRPLEPLIECLKAVGLKYVEIWPKHLPFEAEADEIRSSLATLAANGISLESYGQVSFDANQQQTRAVFEFAKLAGISAITADVAADAVQVTDSLCQEYDINLAIHNHGRNHCYGTMAQLDELFAATSKRFGICLDTAWMLDAGDDPLVAVERYADRLYGVHLKDFVFDADSKPQDVIIGTGGLDLPRLMKLLDDMDYTGYLSLEYEGNPKDPMDEVKACVQAVQIAIAGL